MTPLEMAKTAALAADSRKATDLKVLEVSKLTVLTDYFIICTGASTTQIRAIADEIEKVLKEKGISQLRIEGYAPANWILMDYGSIVVNIFHPDMRQFYALERLWSDAEPIEFSLEEV